ncbi:EVE domain-containing protein [Reyranella sp. CPCC 100927]|uniref:EVE domain-containing protein n=1 Tax=Reyranella sp. CPCC 100927 TaxID=2599616 RepID=UPI0011B6D79B|nr:EVE domain-containing protein [Reyranella sp. CPCC 100927]TWT15536.1 EVE domain-containing protein [Reyranella sp. CPCC 100927]
MIRSWIAVACAEHVRRGVAGGFMQVSHGKAAPLRRLTPGDRIAYYSSSETMDSRDRLQSFTAIGVIQAGDIEQADMGGGFQPFRRRVRYLRAQPAPIRPLLDRPGFALAGPGWGGRLRFGLVPIDEASMDAIGQAMGVR